MQAKYWHWDRSASLYGLSSRMSFDARITLVESFLVITCAYRTNMIPLIMTDYTIHFGHDSALEHPLLDTEEYMVTPAIPTNHVSGSITEPS